MILTSNLSTIFLKWRLPRIIYYFWSESWEQSISKAFMIVLSWERYSLNLRSRSTSFWFNYSIDRFSLWFNSIPSVYYWLLMWIFYESADNCPNLLENSWLVAPISTSCDYVFSNLTDSLVISDYRDDDTYWWFLVIFYSKHAKEFLLSSLICYNYCSVLSNFCCRLLRDSLMALSIYSNI